MRCSEAFRCNANSAKHPYNVTSHVVFPRKVSGENMIRSGEASPKMSQKLPKLKVIIHAFELSRGLSSERHGMLPRGMGGHWKRLM